MAYKKYIKKTRRFPRKYRKNVFSRKKKTYAISPFINNKFASYRTIMENDWMFSMNEVSGG